MFLKVTTIIKAALPFGNDKDRLVNTKREKCKLR